MRLCISNQSIFNKNKIIAIAELDITGLYSKLTYPKTRFKVDGDIKRREMFFEHVRLMCVNEGERPKVEKFVREYWNELGDLDRRTIMKIYNDNKPSTISSGSEAPRSKNPFLVKI